MNQEWVTITQIEKDGIWVESLQRSACDSCNARSGCGQRSLSQLGRTLSLWIPSTEHFQLGQRVLLELPQGGLALSALLLYGLPLLMLLLAAVFAQPWGEGYAIVAGGLGLLLGLVLSRYATAHYRHLWQPTIKDSCLSIPVTE